MNTSIGNSFTQSLVVDDLSYIIWHNVNMISDKDGNDQVDLQMICSYVVRQRLYAYVQDDY